VPGLAVIATPAPFSMCRSHVLGDAVTDLAWSGGGNLILAGSAAGVLHRFSADGDALGDWQGHEGGVTRVCFKPGDDAALASAGEDGYVRLWDTDSGSEIATLAEEQTWVEHLAWTPDGKVLAAAARKTISLWQGTEPLGVWYDARRHVLAMSWAPDGKRLATAANKGLYLWRMNSKHTEASEPMQLLSFPGAPVAVEWQPNGKALAVGTQDGFLQVWRPAGIRTGAVKNNASQLTMRGYPGKVTCLSWHPIKTIIATAGGPDVVLWELPGKAGAAKGTPLRHHQATITALAWSADGLQLASGDRSGRLCIWDREGKAIFSQVIGHEISEIRWHPKRSILAIGDTAGGLHFLDHIHPHKDPTTTSPDQEADIEQR